MTEIAGTTWDLIEESALLGGIPFTLTDTAGIRATDDPVERIGVQRTRQAIEGADLIFLVIDGAEGLTGEDQAVIQEVRRSAGAARVVAVVNKDDLPRAWDEEVLRSHLPEWPIVRVSAVTGSGIDRLEEAAVSLMVGEARQHDAILVTRLAAPGRARARAFGGAGGLGDSGKRFSAGFGQCRLAGGGRGIGSRDR